MSFIWCSVHLPDDMKFIEENPNVERHSVLCGKHQFHPGSIDATPGDSDCRGPDCFGTETDEDN